MVQLPPLDGTLYLPDVLDFHLTHNPKKLAYIFAQDEFIVKITFEQLARAVHRAAYELRAKGECTNGTVVALIANADVLLYQTIVLACVRAGLVPFMISPRNSVEAIDAMLYKMSCSRVLCIKAHSAETNIINSLSVPDLVVSEIPTLEALYGPDLHGLAEGFELYPSPEENIGPYDSAFIIHSSGSTNFPKPVPQKFLTILHWMSFLRVSGMEDSRVEICAAMGIPSFHAFGVNFQLLYPLALGKPAAIFPPTSFNFVTGQATNDAIPVLPQPATILRHVQLTCSDVLLSVPSLLTAWRSNPPDIEVLKSLRAVCCSSGPLPEGVGDDLVIQGVPLCTSYGATEFGIPTYRLPLNKDAKPTLDFDKNDPARLNEWKYVAFNDLTKLRLIPTNDHDKYELQILTCETHLPAIENLTDVKGYATCDVVQAHPMTKGLWRVTGRSDDVIVLSTGEKVVPNPLQDIIGSSQILSGVIMFGRGKPHCGLIIEPRDPDLWEGRTNELVDEIWPLIEKANSSAPSFSRILRDMIIVTAVDKPMERVGKGSLARLSTLKLYELEMEHAYQRFDLGCSMQPIKTSEAADILRWLTPRAAGLRAQSNLLLDADRDLFELGFDSISAVSLRAQILGAMPKDVSSMIGKMFVYDHPTLSAMAERLASLMSGDREVPATARKEKAIERMVSKYTRFSPLNQSQTISPSNVILLTGSTGSLGSHILEALLRDSRVCKIYLLNRTSASSASERQRVSFLSKGLDASLLHTRKITWLEGDSVDVSEQIQDVNIIIHNAWRLDFNLSLSSYEPLIRSTRALIDFSRTVKHRVYFVFTSSVSVAQNWDNRLGPVPEEILETRYALGKGYGESKHVAERILQKSGVDFTSLRIGQIAGGAPLGAWATSDWVPAMVRTSVEIGALPSAIGVSWIPMPVVAQSTIDVALSFHPGHVLNLVHPYPASWNIIMDNLSASMAWHGVTRTELPTIPFSEWVKRVEKLSNEDAGTLSRAPAVKLLPYFGQFAAWDSQLLSATGAVPEAEAGGRARFVTDKAREVCKTVDALGGPLDRDDVKQWVSFWVRSGFLPSSCEKSLSPIPM